MYVLYFYNICLWYKRMILNLIDYVNNLWAPFLMPWPYWLSALVPVWGDWWTMAAMSAATAQVSCHDVAWQVAGQARQELLRGMIRWADVGRLSHGLYMFWLNLSVGRCQRSRVWLVNKIQLPDVMKVNWGCGPHRYRPK